jgi:hypothetical protein
MVWARDSLSGKDLQLTAFALMGMIRYPRGGGTLKGFGMIISFAIEGGAAAGCHVPDRSPHPAGHEPSGG